MGCICSILISLCTTLAYCTERVSTCAVCSMFLCLIMVGMIILSVMGATLGYQYSQTEITEFKFVRELRRRHPVWLTIPPRPTRSRSRRTTRAREYLAGEELESTPGEPPGPWVYEQSPQLKSKPLPGIQPPGVNIEKQSGLKKIIYSDLLKIFGQNITRSTLSVTVTPHLLRMQTNSSEYRKQVYGKAENILKKMQETNLENLLPPNIELLLKQNKKENQHKASGKTSKENIDEMFDESSGKDLIDESESGSDEVK